MWKKSCTNWVFRDHKLTQPYIVIHLNKDGKLIGVLAMHVDDFMQCRESIFDREVMNKFREHLCSLVRWRKECSCMWGLR